MVFRTEHTVREIINKEVVSELETTVIIIEKERRLGWLTLSPTTWQIIEFVCLERGDGPEGVEGVDRTVLRRRVI